MDKDVTLSNNYTLKIAERINKFRLNQNEHITFLLCFTGLLCLLLLAIININWSVACLLVVPVMPSKTNKSTEKKWQGNKCKIMK